MRRPRMPTNKPSHLQQIKQEARERFFQLAQEGSEEEEPLTKDELNVMKKQLEITEAALENGARIVWGTWLKRHKH